MLDVRMMPYRLRDDLSFCQVGDRLIFLDIEHDRYFRLPAAEERTFTAYLERGADQDVDVGDLIERSILVEAHPSGGGVPTSDIRGPTRSAVEQTLSARRVPFPVLLEVFANVCSIRLQLRRRRLKRILDRLIAYRQKRASSAGPDATAQHEQPLANLAAMFRRARPYVPVETSCLLDSIALVRFLARRGLHASIVFGVTSEPFAAHCWVQVGDLVLNDTVGNANAHTPIRVV